MQLFRVRTLVLQWLRYIYVIEVILNNCVKKCSIRRWWTKPHLKDNVREECGAFSTIYSYFKANDHEEFYNFVGLTVEQFNTLLELVEPKLRKRSRRKALCPELRLAVVLNFLVHGNSIRENSWQFFIGRSTLYKLIPEVCTALCQVLRKKYIPFPKRDDWESISKAFYKRWNFPNCIGALDGKHIRLKCPPNSGSYFFCYKKFFSIVLLALCDAYNRFIWVNIGDFGSSNDAGIFQKCDLRKALDAGQVDLPPPSNLPGTDITCPYLIVADGAFPLKKYIMKPYTRNNEITVEEKIFNYRLSRARLVVECAFGILCKRWKIFEKPLDFKLETSETIVMALICLHNFIITDQIEDLNDDNDNNTNYNEFGMYEGPVDTPYDIQNAFKDYFVSPYGSVPWQWNRI